MKALHEHPPTVPNGSCRPAIGLGYDARVKAVGHGSRCSRRQVDLADVDDTAGTPELQGILRDLRAHTPELFSLVVKVWLGVGKDQA